MKVLIFIHALFWNKMIMKPMENRVLSLLDNDVVAYQFEYKSRDYSQDDLKRLNHLINGFNKEDEIFIIGHSMGGLVGRNYLREYKPQYNISLITLGTPHNQSIVGSIINTVNKNIIKDAAHSGIVSKIKDWDEDYSLYCIAGIKNIPPINVLFPFQKNIKSDGTVMVSEAIVSNSKKNYLVKTNHTGLIYSKEVYKILGEIINSSSSSKELLK